MRAISWAPSFRRAFRSYVRRHPQDQERLIQTLHRLAENIFDPRLGTHKLSGALRGLWACSAAYDCRIVFDPVENPVGEEDAILLIDIGTHDEVY